MKRSKILTAHLIATGIATLTISGFFSFSLIAELLGHPASIIRVKTGILYCLPILLIVMPALAITGKKLVGPSTHPLIVAKMNRMKLIALNGFILIGLAIYLYYHATQKSIDTTFLIVQVVELVFGAFNLTLIGLNIRAGLKLSGRLQKAKHA